VTGEIRLIVRTDDFGMCHAVNEGVRLAHRDGIATVASTMAPCPWFAEAARIAGENGIPLGLHQTLTCEWDWLRWGPLTAGASLRRPDGTFHRTIEEAQAVVTHEDAVAELLAQVERVRAEGLALQYLDHHMGSTLPSAYAEVSEKTGVPFLYSAAVHLDSYNELTPREEDEKKPWLMALLRSMSPGTHMLVSHPGVAGPELAALTSRGSEPWPWAEHWRAVDLKVLTDPEIKGAVERAGIRLCTFTEAVG
jgi:chitin disaccharide deacetylase